MFFFGIASNFITLSILGVFSMIFLYQGVKDATHISKENASPEIVILGQDIQQDLSNTDFHLAFANTRPAQDDQLIYPKFILNDCPVYIEVLPESLSNQNINRGPPVWHNSSYCL